MSHCGGPVPARVMMVAALALCALSPAAAAIPEEWKSWNDPVEPFRIAGNIHYVGTKEIAAYLFVNDEGHILLDGGFEESVPAILRSIETLGFKPRDVKILLNSHAHIDHAGGLARLKEITGAELAASRGDVPLLTGGGDADFSFPPVTPDRIFEDGETISLGRTRLTARVTAGHTPGCTTWTTQLEEESAALDIVFLCSVTAFPETDLLIKDAAWPAGRAAAYAASFDLLESLPIDIFLAPHASFFLMEEKRPKLDAGGPNPFIDPALYRHHLAAKRKKFEDILAAQRVSRSAEPSVSRLPD